LSDFWELYCKYNSTRKSRGNNGGHKKKKGFLLKIFGSELFDNLEEMIEALLEDMGGPVPFVYGFFYYSFAQKEDHEFQEFGKVPEYFEDEENLFPSEIRDPLIWHLWKWRTGTCTCRTPGG